MMTVVLCGVGIQTVLVLRCLGRVLLKEDG